MLYYIYRQAHNKKQKRGNIMRTGYYVKAKDYDSPVFDTYQDAHSYALVASRLAHRAVEVVRFPKPYKVKKMVISL